MASNASPTSLSRLRGDDRVARVAALAQLDHERHLADERHAESLGQQWPPPDPKIS